MSIQDKEQYLLETKELIKQGINNIGGELTNQSTFRSYKEGLDNIYDDMPKVTAEGIELNVTPTKKGVITSRLKGNTSQASYSGKNLFDKNAENTENAYINTTNSTIVSNANARSLYIPIKPNTTYTISRKAGQRFAVISATDYDTGTVGTNIVYNHTGSSLTITTGASDTYLVVFYYLSTADTLTEQEIRDSIQIEEGQTATSYEPYVGGIASPNPQFPQNIHVVTGNNTITVQGKNLWGGFTYSRTSAGVVHTYNEDGSITVKGTATANSTSINISDAVSNNVYKTLQAGTYIVSGGGEDYAINIYDTDSNLLANVSKGTANNSFTITETTNVVLRAQVSNGTQIDVVIKLQLEKGSTATNYEAYVTPQNYSINLGSIELCKIGDYQDYLYKENGNWYKYNAVGKLVLDGTETGWVKSSNQNVDRYVFPINSYINNANSKCNYFKKSGLNNTVGMWTNNSSVQLTLNWAEAGTTTLEQWKTWVSTHNLVLYQPLQEATSTQITDETLISQLEAFNNAMSNNGTTIITQTNADLAFIINASMLRANPTGTISITTNGTHDVSNYENANVNVQPTLQSKSVTPTSSQQVVSPDTGYDGLSSVTVGAVTPTVLQSKSVTIRSNTTQTISPDSGYDGLSSVEITTDVSGSKPVLPDAIRFGSASSGADNYSFLADMDTSNVTMTNAMFADLYGLETAYLFDTSNVTNMQQMFRSCNRMATTVQYDTSKATNMIGMYQGCSALETVPTMNFSSAISYSVSYNMESQCGLYHIFTNCSSLSNTSLNNIMASCLTAKANYSYKTLKHIGLTQTQAETCMTLSNYQAFVNAGWSTGY